LPRRTARVPDESPEQHHLDHFAARALIFSLVFLAVLALGLFLWYSVHVLLLIFAGVLIAILLRGLADFVCDYTGLSHKVSLAIVVVVLATLLGLLFWLGAARLSAQAAQLAEQLPKALTGLRDRVASTQLGKLLINQSPRFNQLVSGRGADLLGSVTGIVSGTLGAIVTVMVVLFTGLFLAADPRLYVKGVVHLVPPRYRDRMAEVLGAVGYTLKWWMIGQAVDMVVIGIATAIGLWLLGVPLALLLGVIAALFNFIPNFGPLFSMVPATLLALSIDPTKAIYVVILFIVLQNLEGYLLMPIIQGKAVDLPGAMAIVSQVLLGILAGALGLALAAPLAAAALVAVKMLYVEDLLGDRIKTPADRDARAEVREVQEATREVERGEAVKR
jgi:predicted PurR-regulated permease PerM